MRVILAYKNFAANKNISHIGLGVAGMNNEKVLLKNGIHAEVWAILDSDHLRKLLNLQSHARQPVTHVIISAPWIATTALNHLCQLFRTIHFAVNCHSNVGFLQADPNGMKFLREDLELEMAVPNFSVAANSKKMKEWVIDAYGNPCAYLPNLYFLHGNGRRHITAWHPGSVLRIGCFGAVRPQKNLASAVGAAIELGHQLKTRTEIWISSGRTEGGGSTVVNTVRQMCKDLPTTTLHEAGWHSWPSFRRLVGSMHLLLQPSYTESFNMVTADGIAEGVASVVGEAIDWVPPYWEAHTDDVFNIAHVARSLLLNHRAPEDGYQALENYLQQGIRSWKEFLERTLHICHR